ncbi:uncharacterized protein LOC124447561 isoform X2 [Xenia sp. Carnegie-2017]|uniref:uncharacterized protein LOC124447561 isoform X2 n=1 Tax=Xenia sp. Carnegie-2017 TaxID=2897299 RepID=UPI001F04A3F7|nr:uncharacterized protein LOC124447561 isoform X2 [Xenia sp. Carnegie-2017]
MLTICYHKSGTILLVVVICSSFGNDNLRGMSKQKINPLEKSDDQVLLNGSVKIAKNQHPTCKNSEMIHSDVISNGVLQSQPDNLTFLGRVKNMKECLGICCSYRKCELAYLVNKTKCFATECQIPENCKVKRYGQKSLLSKDIQMSLMLKDNLSTKGYAAAYIVISMAMLGATLSGSVWIVHAFVRKYKKNKEEKNKPEILSKEPQVY